MAIPVAALGVWLAKGVSYAARNWRVALAAMGLIGASGFMFNAMLRQMGETALGLWPLMAMMCAFVLAKEAIRAWIKVRSKELSKSKRVGN